MEITITQAKNGYIVAGDDDQGNGIAVFNDIEQVFEALLSAFCDKHRGGYGDGFGMVVVALNRDYSLDHAIEKLEYEKEKS
jgi:hypothetical protein